MQDNANEITAKEAIDNSIAYKRTRGELIKGTYKVRLSRIYEAITSYSKVGSRQVNVDGSDICEDVITTLSIGGFSLVRGDTPLSNYWTISW